MKLPVLTRKEALSLLDELRSMATLEQGPDRKLRLRAKEICVQLQAQEWAAHWVRDLGELYLQLEVLLSSRRWRDLLSVDALRSEIDGICSRLSKSWSAAAGAV
jgi:hypothetical protein